MGFLAAYDALTAPGGDPTLLRQARLQLLGEWLSQHQVELLIELGQHRPVFASPMATFVTTFDDVQEVLSRPAVFSTRPYNPRMENVVGPFFIGEDNTPAYQRIVSITSLAIRREDLPTIRAAAGAHADEVIARAAADGRLDVVQRIGRDIPYQFLATYFGVPGPDQATLLTWTQALFHEIFFNLFNSPQVTADARAAGQALSAYVDGLIAARKAALDTRSPAADDVVTRFVRMQRDPSSALNDADIRDTLIGLLVATTENTSTVIAHVLDELLRRPDQFAAAARAVLDGDEARLTAYVYEAWRLNPVSTMVVRFTEQEYVLAKGTSRATTIPAGTLVLAALAAAMFDPTKIDDPASFRVDRPLDSTYMHFGYGLHTCFGRYIGHVHVIEALKRLLVLPNLQRAQDSEAIQFNGPFPSRFVVEFDAKGAIVSVPARPSETSAPPSATPLSGVSASARDMGVHNIITAIAPLKPGSADHVKQLLAALNTASASPIAQIATIHFARWVLIDNDTRMLFCVEFDGNLDDYLDEFIAKAPDGLDAIFGSCEGYPAGGSRDSTGFKAFVQQWSLPAALFYCAYPDATVKDITTALRVRQNLDALLDDFQ